MNVFLSVGPFETQHNTERSIDPATNATNNESVHPVEIGRDAYVCTNRLYPIGRLGVGRALVLQRDLVLDRIYSQLKQLEHYPTSTSLFVYT